MLRRFIALLLGLSLLLISVSCNSGVTQPPEESSITKEIRADEGGSISLGSATLNLAPNVLSQNARITLKETDQPNHPDEDPLKYVSKAYIVSAEGLGSGEVKLTQPAILSIETNISTQAAYQSLLVAQVEPELSDFVQLYPSKDEAKSSYEYKVFKTIQWVIAVPLLNQTPTEANILQVPWYHQSGIPWCVPTSLTAMLRYYDFTEVAGEPLNTSFGQSTALANWQMAAQSDQAAENGAGYGELDKVGVNDAHTTEYLWDADALVGPTTSVKGYYDDFQTYVTLVNSGLFGLITKRPLAMGVDNWWHSVAIVGIDGDGFFYHDSNGLIAHHVAWDDFQDQATAWKTDSEGNLVYKDKVWTAVIYDYPVKPRAERDGSIVIRQGDISFTAKDGHSSALKWDGETQHSYGYYFEDSVHKTASDKLNLGYAADTTKPLSYRYRIANITNTKLTYQSVAELSGPSYGANKQQHVHTITVEPYSLSDYVQGTFESHPPVPSGQTAIFSVTLNGIKDLNLVQDVKLIRYEANNAPSIKILEPKEAASFPYGGLFGISLKASVNDVEDGANCCTLTWSSDVDGQIGTGTELSYTFPSPGARVVTVTASDSDGNLGSSSINVTATNSAPTVSITKPSSTDVLYTNTPYVFDGDISDANEPLKDLCPSATWKSTVKTDPPFSGCNPTVIFTTAAKRTLTLVATDTQGLTGSSNVTFRVVNKPLEGPPIVSILEPKPGVLLSYSKGHVLNGTATDPDGGLKLSYEWVVMDGGKRIPIGTSASFSWTPGESLVSSCGSRQVELYLYVTDPDGQTGSDHITIYILFPVC